MRPAAIATNRFLLFAAAALLLLASPSRAQDPAVDLDAVEYVLLDDVHPGVDGASVVDLYFRALTRYRLPVEDLQQGDLAVHQDGKPIDPLQIASLRRVDDADLGIACVIALDTSRTMMGAPFQGARDAALRFLSRLGPSDRTAVITFSSRVDVVAGFDSPLEQTRALLETLEPDRTAMSTVVYDGVHRAATLLRETTELPRRTFAIVFSDGRDGGSEASFEDVIAIARGGGSEPRIPVFTIGYTGRGADGLDTLRQLASETGADSTRAVDLNEFYDDVLRQMRQSYVLRFETDLDGATHQIKLAIESASDSRAAAFPAVYSPTGDTPPYAAWGAGVVLVLLAAVAVREIMRRRPPTATLRFVEGPRADERISLVGDRARIGALPDNEVAIPVQSVSRFHAEIQIHGTEYKIVDLDSTNGTRINGAPIREAALRDGDRIRVGEIELVFEA